MARSWSVALVVVAALTGLVGCQASQEPPPPTPSASDPAPTPTDDGRAPATTVGGTVDVGTEPLGILADPDGGRLYVASAGDGSVAVIDTATQEVVTTLEVGSRPAGMALDAASGTLYVVDVGGDEAPGSVVLVDVEGPQVTGSIDVQGINVAIALDSSATKGYVVSAETGQVHVLDLAARTVASQIDVGGQPGVVAADGSGRAYVTDFSGGQVVAIDTTTDTVLGRVPVSPAAGVLAVHPDGNPVYVGHFGDTGPLAVVMWSNMGASEVTDTVELEASVGSVSLDAVAGALYLTHPRTGTVSVLDLESLETLATVEVGGEPTVSAVDASTGTLYVADRGSGTVSVIVPEAMS